MSYYIREFRTSDFGDVRRIVCEAWGQSHAVYGVVESMDALLQDESLTFLLPKMSERALVGYIDEQSAGVVVTRRTRGVNFILGLYVRPRFQRKNLGRSLLVHAAQQASELPILEAHVIGSNTRALAFYRALGFEEAGRRSLSIFDGKAAGVVVMRIARDILVKGGAE